MGAKFIADEHRPPRFICPDHGEVEFECFYFAGLRLSCGCIWRHMDGRLVHIPATPETVEVPGHEETL